MGEIYLIRHGQASFGSDNYDRLSELGTLQSQILASHLKSIGFKPNRLISGPLERHRATALAFQQVYGSEGIDIPALEIVEEFREYNAKAIIMATVKADPSLVEFLPKIYEDPDAFRKVFNTAMRAWVNNSLDFGDIESFEDLKKRVEDAMEVIRISQGRAGVVAVFTSGGAIAASLANIVAISSADAIRLNRQIVNTSVTRYVFDDHRITLAGFNAIDHLKLERDPSLITWY